MLTLLETFAWLLLLTTCVCWGCTIITNLFRNIAKSPRWWNRVITVSWPGLILLVLFGISGFYMLDAELDGLDWHWENMIIYWVICSMAYFSISLPILGIIRFLKLKQLTPEEKSIKKARLKKHAISLVLAVAFTFFTVFFLLAASLVIFNTVALEMVGDDEMLIAFALILASSLLWMPGFYLLIRWRLHYHDSEETPGRLLPSKSGWLLIFMALPVLLVMTLLAPVWSILGVSYENLWFPALDIDGLAPHDAFWPFFAIIPAYFILTITWHLVDKIRWKKNPDRMPWRLGRRWLFAAFVPQLCMLTLIGLCLVIQWQARVNLHSEINYWSKAYQQAGIKDPEADHTLQLYTQHYQHFRYIDPVGAPWAEPGEKIYPYSHSNLSIEDWGVHQGQMISDFDEYGIMVRFYKGMQDKIQELEPITQRPKLTLIKNDPHAFGSFELSQLSTFLKYDAMIAIEEKHYDRAFRNIMMIKRISRHLFEDDELSNKLTSFVIDSMANRQLHELHVAQPLSESQWQLWWTIPEINMNHNTRNTMIWTMERTMRDLAIHYVLDSHQANELPAFWPKQPLSTIPFALFRLDRSMAHLRTTPWRYSLALESHGIETIDIIDPKGRMIQSSEWSGDDFNQGFYNNYSFKILLERWSYSITEHQSLRIMHALHKYGIDHAHYPNQLSDLVPNYLKTIPHDAVFQSDIMYINYPDGRVRIVHHREDYERFLELLNSEIITQEHYEQMVYANSFLLPAWGKKRLLPLDWKSENLISPPRYPVNAATSQPNK